MGWDSSASLPFPGSAEGEEELVTNLSTASTSRGPTRAKVTSNTIRGGQAAL